jgi:hypothetical protein
MTSRLVLRASGGRTDSRSACATGAPAGGDAYDRSKGRQTIVLSFIVNRPPHNPGFALARQIAHDRVMRYTLHSYATDKPKGQWFTG